MEGVGEAEAGVRWQDGRGNIGGKGVHWRRGRRCWERSTAAQRCNGSGARGAWSRPRGIDPKSESHVALIHASATVLTLGLLVGSEKMTLYGCGSCMDSPFHSFVATVVRK